MNIGVIGWILGGLIFANMIFNIFMTQNWAAVCGWLMAMLEWLRRFLDTL